MEGVVGSWGQSMVSKQLHKVGVRDSEKGPCQALSLKSKLEVYHFRTRKAMAVEVLPAPPSSQHSSNVFYLSPIVSGSRSGEGR